MVSLDLLARYPYFADVRLESLQAIAAITTEQQFKAGEVLFREGAAAKYLYVLQQGEVDILHDQPNGEPRVVETVVPVSLLCWSAIVEPHRTTATAVARADSKVLRVEGPRISALCRQDHHLGYLLMTHVARTVRSRLKAARVQLAGGRSGVQ